MQDYTLSTDSLQSQTYAEARDFTSAGLIEGLETGPLLACIVIFMWTLSVTEVLRAALDFLLMVRHLHQQMASDTFSICQLGRGDVFAIDGVTQHRICWATFVGVLQLCIAFCLLLSGALWLAYTKSIPDLLANAVALSLVMQVDELLYQVLVPRRVKALVSNLEPIDMSKSSGRKLPEGIPKKALGTARASHSRSSRVGRWCASVCFAAFASKMRAPASKIRTCPP
mmetsp:Transcript_127907/g.358081  ORF Transcript_127907/g.358081 Transcript_127907/m.358081 type:complete len:227 (-) Transcript_127907:331-1011(-)